MTVATSYQLHNWWHGLGVVGHVVLAVLLVLAVVVVIAIGRRA